MNILVYSDNHFCQNSSIIRGRGNRFSDRLENQLNTLLFIEETAKRYSCSAIFNCGDFFDKPELNSEEISALKEVQWDVSIPHYYIVGNHDASNKSLSYNATNVLASIPNSFVIDKPSGISISGVGIYFLPYVSTNNNESISLEDIFGNTLFQSNKRLLLSHNEINGLQYGKYVSTSGLNIEEVSKYFDMCINGHLHNFMRVTDKIINIGNVTGQNFSEDGFQYSHNIAIFNTESFSIQYVENPFAFNFYKVDTKKLCDSVTYMKNAVVSVSCEEQEADSVRKIIKENNNIKYYKITVTRSEYSDKEQLFNDSSTPKNKFSEFIINVLGNDLVVAEELNLICEGE
jgi:DNA repair exonuclease SbcCD nuclease subunit